MKKIFAVTLLLIFILSLFSACSGTATYQSLSSGIEDSSSSLITDESPSSSSDNSSISDESSTESNPPEDTDLLPEIETDDTAFNDKFKSNILDSAYQEELEAAYSASQWVEISGKYAELWQKEIDNAYKCLLVEVDDTATVKEEHIQWLDSSEEEISTLKNSVTEEGGSLVQFNVSNEIMLIYRKRAAELYKQLYSYDPDFSFSFVANG